jgi:acylpyruvate hydrolase
MIEVKCGSEIYRAGTIFCIGRNYSEHIKEMGGANIPEPTVFLKPAQAIVHDGGECKLPPVSKNVHYEAEMALLVGKDCIDTEAENYREYIAGIGIGIDLTLRDIQKKAKESGSPWAVAKGFFNSAPLSDFTPLNDNINPDSLPLKFFLNGELKQDGNTSEMERNCGELTAYLSKIFTLKKGDIIFTGTPSGVGQVNKGDLLEARLGKEINLKVKISGK